MVPGTYMLIEEYSDPDAAYDEHVQRQNVLTR